MTKTSAGILLYRFKKNLDLLSDNEQLEIFLTHPGGPFNKNRDLGAWSIVKGEIDKGEDYIQTALRELGEETYVDIKTLDKSKFIELGTITQKNGKIVHAWSYEYNNEIKINILTNLATIEWPPKSEKELRIPENDRGEWFKLETAKQKINPAQVELIERLKKSIKL